MSEHKLKQPIVLMNEFVKFHPTLFKFIHALIHKDKGRLASCLHEKGTFSVFTANRKSEVKNKVDFLQWFIPRMLSADLEKIALDQCVLCKLGNETLIINDGSFPVRTDRIYEKDKLGLVLSYKEELIFGIGFCVNFKYDSNSFLWQKQAQERMLLHPNYWKETTEVMGMNDASLVYYMINKEPVEDSDTIIEDLEDEDLESSNF